MKKVVAYVDALDDVHTGTLRGIRFVQLMVDAVEEVEHALGCDKCDWHYNKEKAIGTRMKNIKMLGQDANVNVSVDMQFYM